MKKQYYTPRLKEFKTGFRYEHYIPSKEVWAKETFYLNENHINIINYVDIQTENTLLKVRTKSLDHDDIIEAGWDENQNQSSEFLADYILGDYLLDIFDSERGIRINYRHETVFFGKIANYNKLLDVMEMLGINKTV
jgi:hypothetical protein